MAAAVEKDELTIDEEFASLLPDGIWQHGKEILYVVPHIDTRYVFVTAIKDGIASGTKRGILRQYARRFAETHLAFEFPKATYLGGRSDPVTENHWIARQASGPRAHAHSHTVYFVQAECGGPIKIGKASCVRARIGQFQMGCPFRLVLLGVVANESPTTEAELHRRFAADRLHGEWFAPEPELVDFIAREAQ